MMKLIKYSLLNTEAIFFTPFDSRVGSRVAGLVGGLQRLVARYCGMAYIAEC